MPRERGVGTRIRHMSAGKVLTAKREAMGYAALLWFGAGTPESHAALLAACREYALAEIERAKGRIGGRNG